MQTPPGSSSAARASRRDSGTPTTLGERTTGVTNEQLQKRSFMLLQKVEEKHRGSLNEWMGPDAQPRMKVAMDEVLRPTHSWRPSL